MSLVSKSVSSQHDNKQNIENYEQIIKEIRGQQTASEKLNITSNETIRSIKEKIKLGKKDLLSFCPILLYQLTKPNECIQLLPSKSSHDHLSETDRTMGE